MVFKIYFLLLYFLIFNTNAYAYLDPGLGSIILQGIVAALAATSLTIKIYWQKIKQFFKKFKKTKNDDK